MARPWSTKRQEKRRPESNCPKCKHAIFDETWGEYKCAIRKRYIHSPDDYTSCKNYKKAD